MESAVLESSTETSVADPSLAMVDPAYVNGPDAPPADPDIVAFPVTNETSAPRPSSLPPAPTDEELAIARETHYEEIRENERNVRDIEANWASLKERSNEAKKEFDAADKALRFLIARGPQLPQKFPVRVRAAKTLIMPKIEVGQEFAVVEVNFMGSCRIVCDPEGGPDGDWVKPGDEVDVIEWGKKPEVAAAPVESEEPIDESWKETPIQEALGLTDPQVAKFVEMGVENMGQFEQLREDIANSRAVWPKGIGKEKRGKIVDAAITWLNQNVHGNGDPIEDESFASEDDDLESDAE